MGWEVFAGMAGSASGGPWKGASMQHEDRSPMFDALGGNFYRTQDEYEDNRQLSQQERLNMMQANYQLQLERRSFEQKMAMAKEQNLHPLSVLGIPMSAPSFIGSSNMSGQDNGSVSFTADHRKPDPVATSEQNQLDAITIERQKQALRKDRADADVAEMEADRARGLLQGQPGRPPGAVTSADRQVAVQSAITGVPKRDIRVKGGDGNMAGSGDAGLITIKPDEISATRPDNPGLAAGAPAGFRQAVMPDGSVLLIPDQNVIQTEIDEGATFNALVNHGVSPRLALDIIGLGPYIVGGGVGAGALIGKYLGRRAARKAAERVAELEHRRRQRKAWKGGE